MDMAAYSHPRRAEIASERGRSAVVRRAAGALGAALLAGAAVLATPVELLELALASTGLTEILPALAPPLGWAMRLAVAAIPALIAAGIFWTFDDTGPRRAKDRGRQHMAQARSFGWQALARFARGGSAERAAPAASPSMPAAELSLPPVDDWTDRRRADLHPDAPPRPPLIASRDLPKLEAVPASPPQSDDEEAQAVRGAAPVAPVRVTTATERPRPLPRSPEPLSHSELAELRQALAELAPRRPTTVGVPAAEAAAQGGTPSLRALVDRFEAQVDRRTALEAVQQASEALDAVSAVAPTPAAPVTETATAPALATTETAPDIEPEMDQALQTALEQLRRLSAQSRRR